MADTNVDFSVDSSAEDPFAGVDFTKSMPSMNGDNVLQLLNAFNPNQAPVQNLTSSAGTPITKAFDVQAGVDRVNANSRKTGAVAVRDSQGKVTLTNVAIDATGKESPIFPRGGGASNNPPGDYQASTAVSMPVANNVYNALSQLKGANDINAARGIFANLQESLVNESNKIENDATIFALNKIGVPKLESMLAQSEVRDRSSPTWQANPGIGDSPDTAKLRAEVAAARGQADLESKRYLENNLGYKMLKNNAAQATVEMTRVQKVADRKSLISDTIDLHRNDRNEAKAAELELTAGKISPNQMDRIQILSPGVDFSGNDGNNPKVTAMQLYAGNKDKNFQAAVNAEGSELPILALMGNASAETLVVRQEATNTQLPESQIRAQLQSAKIWMMDPKNIIKAITKMSGNSEDAKKNVAAHTLALTSGDVGEKNKATAVKAQAALWYMRNLKNAQFKDDVSSWGSIDPALATAATSAAKKNGGKKDLESVLTEYVGDTVGPEAHKRYGDFIRLIDAAGDKHVDSFTGGIDTMGARATVIKASLGANMFKRWMDSIGKVPFETAASTISPGAGDLFKLGHTMQDSEFAKSVRLRTGEFAKSVRLMTGIGEQPTAPIDPVTGKPIGEK